MIIMDLRKCDYFSGERCSLMLLIRAITFYFGSESRGYELGQLSTFWENLGYFKWITELNFLLICCDFQNSVFFYFWEVFNCFGKLVLRLLILKLRVLIAIFSTYNSENVSLYVKLGNIWGEWRPCVSLK